jgi:hypothetical protein
MLKRKTEEDYHHTKAKPLKYFKYVLIISHCNAASKKLTEKYKNTIR